VGNTQFLFDSAFFKVNLKVPSHILSTIVRAKFSDTAIGLALDLSFQFLEAAKTSDLFLMQKMSDQCE
jgi:hypothetical protein